MGEFKTALQEILKQQDEQGKNYKKGLEKFEESFAEQQWKMLTSNKNEDSGVFHRMQSKMQLLNLIISLKRK